ncbi:MAG: hypothetical protein WA771_13875 [Chthoniobacterales bacterium]
MREEELPRMRQRYVARNREGRTRMIDEVCEQWGYSRKHAIKLLGAKAGWGGDPGRTKGRPVDYGEEVADVLWKIWKASEQPCGKRLAAMRKLWLPYYEARSGKLSRKLKEKVLAISAAQIDRLLAVRKVRAGARGRSGTKPGGLLKNAIPIRTDNWDIDRPGYLEADTVAHCGGSLEGDFVWSVTYTDIHSGWTANRAVWNKGATGIVAATREVEAALPFEVLGFDCDNGSEFLNWHLVRYFQERSRPVGFTRSRPYHKDDNGHVEEKNWTRVRQLFGYDRFGEPELLDGMNSIYREIWEPLHNFFQPSMKLVSKERHGAKIKRRHDQPRTPCDRLLESEHVDAKTKAQLRQARAAFDPFALHEELERRLGRVLHLALRSSRPTGSLHSAPDAAHSHPTTVS